MSSNDPFGNGPAQPNPPSPVSSEQNPVSRICTTCGTVVAQSTAFCPQCGEDLRPRHSSRAPLWIAGLLAVLLAVAVVLIIAGVGGGGTTTITQPTTDTTIQTTTVERHTTTVVAPTTVTEPPITITETVPSTRTAPTATAAGG